MKKILLLSLLLAPIASMAEIRMERVRGGGFHERMTDAQRACIDSHNCPRLGRVHGQMHSPEEMQAARDCMYAAFIACGIDRPMRE